MGFIIGSSKAVSCTFRPDQAGPTENYTGTFSRFGLDIGATAAGVMIWGVFTATSAGPGFLAGDYVGATAEATLAAGLGANVLIGGSNRTVALQPVSVSGQVGLNFAIGIGDLHLRSSRASRAAIVSDGRLRAALPFRHANDASLRLRLW